MQIRLTPDLEERARSARAPMSVDEFLARFPEVPGDLRDEPVLDQYAQAFGPLLRVAQKPTPCMRDGGDAQHVFYTRLVNDLAIYGIGLAKRDRTRRGSRPCSKSTGSSPRPSRAPSCRGGRRGRLARAARRSPVRSSMRDIFFVSLLVDGVLAGAIYALVALAFVIVYKASRMINFALGEWAMLGSRLVATGLHALGLGLAGASRRVRGDGRRGPRLQPMVVRRWSAGR